MANEIIRVFPDYMSSGLWLTTGENIDVVYLDNTVQPVLLTALKYWHEAWEVSISEDKRSEEYTQQWIVDGRAIVDAMNECQTRFNFVYEEY